MPEKYLTPSGVLLLLFKGDGSGRKILLQKRYHTGYADEMWDLAAVGHVEANESMKLAVVREAKEELGIDIKLGDVHFATLTHKREPISSNTYYNAYFVVDTYDGVPRINEPDKCSALQWFNLKALPVDFIEERKRALENYFANVPYDEVGWG